MKTVIKMVIYTLLAISLSNTFNFSGQHGLAIMYFSLLGFAVYEAIKSESKGEVNHVKRC